MKKIICWGTGKVANSFMATFEKRYSASYEITSFSDNDKSKWGMDFWGKQVIPFDLNQECDYILVLNSYFDDIRNQLIKTGVGKKKILSQSDLINIYIKEYWKNKNILFYGDKHSFEYIEYMAKYTFNTYIFCENGKSVPDTSCVNYVFLCPPRYLSPADSKDYELALVSKLNGNNYLFRDDYMWFLDSKRKLCFGHKNKDKTFCIIHGQDCISGWGNILLNIASEISYAEENNMIPVIDMQNIKNQYLSVTKFGKANIWNDFFMPLNDYSLSDVYKSKNVILSGNTSCHGKCYRMDKIVLNTKIKTYVDSEYARLFPKNEKIMGVVYRGTDYYRAYNHPRPATIQELVKLVSEKMLESGCKYIFLATEIEDATIFFKKHFGSYVFFTEQKRYSVNERNLLADVHFNREDDEYQKGLEYLIVLELLSKCNSLFGLNTAATICAEAFRGNNYEYRYVMG